MKTNNQTNQTTATNATQTKLQDLMRERNRLIEWHNADENALAICPDFESVNAEIVQTLSEIATYKTLKFLMSNNATNGQKTETADNGQINTYGYNMALQLFNNAYNDIKLLRSDEIIIEKKKPLISTDTADLIQESNAVLYPYFNSNAVFSLDDTIYTKALKNGNVKNYTAFQLACKTIRQYITAQDKKQCKKLAYCIGYTNSGAEVLTTKRPKNEIDDIDENRRQSFVNRYHLTTAEQTAIIEKLNGLTTTETAEKMGVSKRTIERFIASAKNKIATADRRIKL